MHDDVASHNQLPLMFGSVSAGLSKQLKAGQAASAEKPQNKVAPLVNVIDIFIYPVSILIVV